MAEILSGAWERPWEPQPDNRSQIRIPNHAGHCHYRLLGRTWEASDAVSSGLQTTGWTRVPAASVEDLSDAILGAGLEVTQMSRAPVTGSLAFATFDRGITCTSGYIGGRVALTGPLSASMVTLGVGLIMAPGTRHWLNEVPSGVVGVFLPGDEHDALYTPGSLYAGVTLPAERLEEIAAQHDLVLDLKTLQGTGIDARKRFSAPDLSRLRTLSESTPHVMPMLPTLAWLVRSSSTP